MLYVGVHVSKKSVRLVYVRRHVDETTTSGGRREDKKTHGNCCLVGGMIVLFRFLAGRGWGSHAPLSIRLHVPALIDPYEYPHQPATRTLRDVCFP